jgi:hypothetical protein
MKFLALLGLLFVVLFITAQAVSPPAPAPAPPAPSTTTVATFDGNQCKSLLNSLWPEIKLYNTQLENPIESIKWLNFTDVKVAELKPTECRILKSRNGLYRFLARGIDAKITGHFSYLLKEGILPSLTTDKGTVSLDIKNAQLLSRLALIPERQGLMSKFIAAMNKADKNADVKEKPKMNWVAKVGSVIPIMTVTVSDSPYATLYNQLLGEQNPELRLFAKVMINEQLKTWAEDYCNNKDHHCEGKDEELVNYLKKYTPNVVTGPTDPHDDDDDDDDDSDDFFEDDHKKHVEAPKPPAPPTEVPHKPIIPPEALKKPAAPPAAPPAPPSPPAPPAPPAARPAAPPKPAPVH